VISEKGWVIRPANSSCQLFQEGTRMKWTPENPCWRIAPGAGISLFISLVLFPLLSIGVTYNSAIRRTAPTVTYTPVLPPREAPILVPSMREPCSLVADDMAIWRIDAKASRRSIVLKLDNSDPVSAFHCSMDERRLVIGTISGHLGVFDSHNVLVYFTPPHSGPITAIQVSRSGRWCFSASDDGEVRLWSLNTQQYSVIAKQKTGINCLAIDSVQRRLAFGNMDGRVFLIDLEKQRTRLLGTLSDPISAISFSPCGHFVVAGSSRRLLRGGRPTIFVSSNLEKTRADANCVVKGWDCRDNRTICQRRIAGNQLTAIAIASGGAHIAASTSTLLTVWDRTYSQGRSYPWAGKKQIVALSFEQNRLRYHLSTGGADWFAIQYLDLKKDRKKGR